jgi:hypothetical protein
MNIDNFPKWICGKCRGILIYEREIPSPSSYIRLRCVDCSLITHRKKYNNWSNIKSKFIEESQLLEENRIPFEKGRISPINIKRIPDTSNASTSDSDETEDENDPDIDTTEVDMFGRVMGIMDSITKLDEQIEDCQSKKKQLSGLLDENKIKLEKMVFKKRKIELSDFFQLNYSNNRNGRMKNKKSNKKT